MAQADIDWRFYSTIQRAFDSDGHHVVRGMIKVNNGYICARARDQWELGEKLDELVLLVLDWGLHD
jgi:hypothetical protein